MLPEQAREMSAARAAQMGPAPSMASTVDHMIPVADGSILVRVLTPHQKVRGVFVLIHGGGWVIGSAEQSDTVARKLAERTSCAVVVVDYRLAPEHPYPIAVDDCWTALQWAAEQMDEIAGRDVPLIVAGDSAGGNLAAVMAVRARDRNGPNIALQVLIYPATDCDLERDSVNDPDNQLILTKDAMTWFWDHYAPDVERRTEPEASPLRTPDLTNLPPAVVMTAEHDVLRDEGEAYADRLREAGVEVDFRRHLGQTHAFFTMLMLPGSERGFQQVVKAVQACIVKHEKHQARTAV